MRFKKSLLLGAAVLFSSCATTTTEWSEWTPKEKEKSIIGYYAGWTLYARNGVMKATNLDYSKWTRMTFAFYLPDDDGTIRFTDSYADADVLFGSPSSMPTNETHVVCFQSQHPTVGIEDKCQNRKIGDGLIELAHKQGVEVYPSIGGWTLSDKFSAIAEDPVKRAKFASESVRLVREYNFDGIDVDWEYPGYEPHNGRPVDKVNFITFMQEIKDSLADYAAKYRPERVGERRYKVTAAMGCGPSIVKNAFDMPKVRETLDEVNLMTYDLHGAWDPVTGHNAPLFEYTSQDFGLSISGCVETFHKGRKDAQGNVISEGGIPLNQLNIGAGFYGRAFANSTGLGVPHDGADKGNFGLTEGFAFYYAIDNLINTDKLDLHWDDIAKVPWASHKDGSGTIFYENEKALRIKSQWLNAVGLAGVIVWDNSGDVLVDKYDSPPVIRTPLIDELHKYLNGEKAGDTGEFFTGRKCEKPEIKEVKKKKRKKRSRRRRNKKKEVEVAKAPVVECQESNIWNSERKDGFSVDSKADGIVAPTGVIVD